MKLTRLLSTLLAACLSMSLLCTGSLAVSDSAKLETIQVLGILSGDGSGNLNLSSSVTRAQFVTMMVAASSHKDAVEVTAAPCLRPEGGPLGQPLM